LRTADRCRDRHPDTSGCLSLKPVRIRELTRDDWPDVTRIYAEGIAAGATFATEPPVWEAWDASHTLRVVAERNGEVVGWAALEPTSTREVYHGVERSSVYVTRPARGEGIGRALMTELVARSEREGIWTIEAGMFPENEASLALYVSLGFRIVGIRERIGRRDGVWRDVLLLERRSEVVA
jgi:phosphinothricin acetyltransferase